MKKITLTVACLLICIPCGAAEIIVDPGGSGDHTTIQEAINAAGNNDIITVRPGTYNENINFLGKPVRLTSNDPADRSVVDETVIAVDSGYSVTFDQAEGSGSVLAGFTISGRGILCDGTSPLIAKNTIKDCQTSGIEGRALAAPTVLGNKITGNSALKGGGISECNGLIAYNVISGNTATERGGALVGCNGTVANNLISGNTAESGGGLCSCLAVAGIINNTIIGNMATIDGGALFDCPTTVSNNIIAYNEAASGGGIHGPSLSSYNDLWDNDGGNYAAGAAPGTGDISADPLFVIAGYRSDTWEDGSYHLLAGSPCIDAGNNATTAGATIDLDGQDRFFDDPDTSDSGSGTAPVVDMGAYEFRICGSCLGDMTGDGWISPLDVDAMVNLLLPQVADYYWLQAPGGTCGDLDSDGWLSSGDVSALVSMLLLHADTSYWSQCEN